MADRKEIINQLTSLMKEGKISDAYRAYEELPFVDQIIVAVAPGVGDALAGYEIKEFSSRAAKNVEDKDYLGATGNFAIASLAGLSLIPLFRWLRGTKGAAKAATEIATPRRGKAGLKGPGEYQAEQAAKKEAAEKAAEETLIKAEKKLAAEKEAAKKAELPVVEEFIPLTGKQLEYPGTRVSKSTKEITGLTSKVAKFINNNNNFSGKNEFLKTQGKIGTYINALKKAPGITEGELRLLRLVDETGEIHPAVLKELAGRNPNTRITRQRLSQYIQTNQKEALQRRLVAKGEREAGDRLIQNNRDVPLSKEKEYSYHVKGIKRGDYLGRHYTDYPEHKPHYSFDAAADLNLAEVRAADSSVFPIRSNADIMGPTTPIIKSNDAVLNVGRIQSDYSKELGKEFDNNKLKQIELIVRKPSVVSLYDDLTISINRMRDEVSNDLIGSPSFLKQSGFIEAIAATARKTPDLKSSDQLQKAFIKEQEKLHKLVEEGKPLTKSDLIIVPSDLSAFAKIEGSSVKDSISKITKNIKEFNGLDIFEPFIKSTKEVKEISSISPYIDNKAIATLRKELSNYNKNVPIINKLSLDEVKLQDKIKKIQKETKLTKDSPSIANDLAKLDSIQDMRTGLMSKSVLNNMDSFKGFTLSPKELTDATGKTFEESLDKSLDQIFYDFKTIDERTGAIQQTFTGTPLERATEYFNQTVNNNKMTYDIGKGIKLLKEATDINIDNFKGFPLDPYAKGTKTEMFKFPVRSRFLEAVTKGYDGFSLDSAAKRLGDEGGQGTDFLETFYDKDVPNEINKMLKELGVNPKEYVGKVSAADNFPYSGTYVKIDDALRKLVQEKGIDAFKDGGPVKDDLPDVQPVQSNYATEEEFAEAYAAQEADYARRVETAKYHDPQLYEIYSIEDPETRDRALDEYKDFSFFRDVLPFIPINVKQYAYHMAGGKGNVDINDLTKKEQEAYYRYAQEIMASGELPLDQDSSVMMDYGAYGTESDYGDIYWGKKNLGMSDEKFEAWKRGELDVVYGSGRKGKRDYSYEEFLEEFPGALDSDGQSIGDLITNMQDDNYVAKTFTGKADVNYNKDSNTITVTDDYNHNRDPKATTKKIIEAFIADPSLYAALKAGAVLKNADGSVIELDLGSPEFVKNFDTTGYAIGGPVSIDNMLSAL